MESLPEIENVMSFLTRNNFIAGPDNPPNSITSWVSKNVTFYNDWKTINDENTVAERNVGVQGTLEADQQNYKTSMDCRLR